MIAQKYPNATIITGGALGTDMLVATLAIKAGLRSKVYLPFEEEARKVAEYLEIVDKERRMEDQWVKWLRKDFKMKSRQDTPFTVPRFGEMWVNFGPHAAQNSL